MTLHEAINLIRPGVTPSSGIWADIGAGTGLFTEALMEILEEGKVIAVDKSPHGLHSNKKLAMNNKQLAMGNEQFAKNKRQLATGHKQLAKNNKKANINVEIVEADFNMPISLPSLDGILMANALHYANDHLFVLKNVLTSLKSRGTFILIEYDTEKPNPPWVPKPVSSTRFRELCKKAGLKEPVEIGRRHSIYQDGEMYVAMTCKVETVDH
ncbi:MAG: class I SAM-dependent methyltransferase [Saprospiraceae bacterium]